MAHDIKRNPNQVAALASDDEFLVHDASANLQGAVTLEVLSDALATLEEGNPVLTLTSTTASDADGARDCDIVFEGTQSGGEESRLAQIKAEHDGAADDEKGRLRFYTNDGNDAAAPTLRLTLDSAGLATFAGDVSVDGGQATIREDGSPSLTVHNLVNESADGGRESKIVFKGERAAAAGTVNAAEIEVAHGLGTDNTESDMIFKVNLGSLAASPAEVLRLDGGAGVISTQLQLNVGGTGLCTRKASGALNEGAAPAIATDIANALGSSPSAAITGLLVLVKDTNGTALLYLVACDGTDYWYTALTKAT